MDKATIPILKDNYYHIFNRGNNGDRIFYNDRNYIYFLEKFNEYLKEHAELYSYCLLPNHFHLLIKVIYEEVDLTDLNKKKLISKSFSDFFNSYSKSINKEQNRTGNLFNRPFKRKLIETNEYFLISIVYVHRNPLHHNATDSFQTYRWSSYSDIVNQRKKYINYNQVIQLFGSLENFMNIHNKAALDFKDISVE